MKGESSLRSWILAGAVLSLPAALLAVLLLSVAIVWHSRWFGIGISSIVTAAFLIGLSGFQNPSRARLLSATGWVSATFGVVALVTSWTLAPGGQSAPADAFQVIHIDPNGNQIERPFNRWSPATLVAEVDQLSMGNALIPWLDPYVDTAKGDRIQSLFQAIYTDMRQESAAHVAVGSQLGSVYKDLAGWTFQDGHGYVYRPRSANASSEPLPVFLFLHGSLGNFKGYLWVLQKLAEKRGIAIVAPSFGAGNWNENGGLDTVSQWIKFCENDPILDHSNITLAGISNGGRGVTRSWASMPDKFTRILCISPILEVEIVENARTHSAVPKLPVLVIHGELDQRVPDSYIRNGIDRLKEIGIACELESFANEDHFLLFSQPDKVVDRIDQWLTEKTAAP